ncbi:MAG: hypothetical protein CMP23_07545 [Rickettsiales bacterium]|nr:hypothetical protein [Rickettsiales bacterium]
MTSSSKLANRVVLHVDDEPGFRGGQRQLLLLAKAQIRDTNGPRPILLVRSRGLLGAASVAGIPHQRWLGANNPLGLLQLHGQLKQGRRPIVHVHDSRSLGAVRLVASAEQQQSLVIHRRIDDVPRDRSFTRWKYARGQIICVSNAVREVMRGFGIEPARLRVIHSTLPPDTRPLPTHAESRSSPTEGAPDSGALRPLDLTAIGALVEQKGHRFLLEALAITKLDHTLRLLGSGPLKNVLLRQRQQLGLERRVQLEPLVQSGSARLNPSSDLLVHPSIREGMGTAVLDAMWAGLPVLASQVGGLSEVIEDNVTGWLIDPQNPRALASKLDELATNEWRRPGWLSEHGMAGRRRAMHYFQFTKMVSAIQQVYDRCP